MSMNNVANLKQWLDLADIDYFTCFVKAWIPFNAWYRHHYEAMERERDILDEIKKDENRIRARFIAKIDGSDTEAEELRNYMAALHHRLSNDPLQDRKKRRISFEQVLIGPNPVRFGERKVGQWIYRVERIASSKQVVSKITSSRGNVICSITQSNGWDIQEFEVMPGYLALSPDDRAIIQQSYNAANPSVFASLLAMQNQNGGTLMMDSYHFSTDKEALFAGLVEVLYSMRNLLFHGEVVPDPQTNRTYEPAYHLLRRLLESIV